MKYYTYRAKAYSLPLVSVNEILCKVFATHFKLSSPVSRPKPPSRTKGEGGCPNLRLPSKAPFTHEGGRAMSKPSSLVPRPPSKAPFAQVGGRGMSKPSSLVPRPSSKAPFAQVGGRGMSKTLVPLSLGKGDVPLTYNINIDNV